MKEEYKTIAEISGFGEVNNLKTDGKQVVKWETFNGWKPKKVYTDYTYGESHREIVVVFVKEADDDNT